MDEKTNDQLTPDDVKCMNLTEFKRRFGFRPMDALEKHWFAGVGKRLTPDMRMAVQMGIVGDFDLSDIVMEE